MLLTPNETQILFLLEIVFLFGKFLVSNSYNIDMNLIVLFHRMFLFYILNESNMRRPAVMSFCCSF